MGNFSTKNSLNVQVLFNLNFLGASQGISGLTPQH